MGCANYAQNHDLQCKSKCYRKRNSIRVDVRLLCWPCSLLIQLHAFLWISAHAFWSIVFKLLVRMSLLNRSHKLACGLILELIQFVFLLKGGRCDGQDTLLEASTASGTQCFV